MKSLRRAASVAMTTPRWGQCAYMDLPLDPARDGTTARANIRGAIFSRVTPTPLQTAPKMAAHSSAAFRDILDVDDAASLTGCADFVDIVAGCASVPSIQPLAHRYGGHQFGVWAGQLGDGRAMLIGEFTNRKGERWELQLKGAGKTPYARFADGRAVLRSSVREFLCSEAMFHLRVPTSRALSLVVSDDTVARDPQYRGQPRPERVAVLLRAAPSWFRFGSLQMPFADGDSLLLGTLADFWCRRLFSAVTAPLSGGARYVAMVAEVARLTARLVAAWQCVGFTHGVLNTDNMSVHGITIDYGPFGFMERYSADFVANSSDTAGLYRFRRQPVACRWNVCRLLDAIEPLISDRDQSTAQLVPQVFDDEFAAAMHRLAAAKLGLAPPVLDLLSESLTDRYPSVRTAPAPSSEPSPRLIADRPASASGAAHDHNVTEPAEAWEQVATPPTEARDVAANSATASVSAAAATAAATATGASVPSVKSGGSQLAESRVTVDQLYDQLLAIMDDTGADFTATWRQLGEIQLDELLAAIEQGGGDCRGRGVQQLGSRYWSLQLLARSCQLLPWLRDYQWLLQRCEVSETERRSRMLATNPRYVLRNWIAQHAIEAAERDDFGALHHVLAVLQHPYTEQPSAEEAGFAAPPPHWAAALTVSCSS